MYHFLFLIKELEVTFLMNTDLSWTIVQQNAALTTIVEKMATAAEVWKFEFRKHGIPADKKWKQILSVLKDDWKPSEKQSIFICEKQSTECNNRWKSKKKPIQLHSERYTETVIPCIWSATLSYLTNAAQHQTMFCTTSESRAEKKQ